MISIKYCQISTPGSNSTLKVKSSILQGTAFNELPPQENSKICISLEASKQNLRLLSRQTLHCLNPLASCLITSFNLNVQFGPSRRKPSTWFSSMSHRTHLKDTFKYDAKALLLHPGTTFIFPGCNTLLAQSKQITNASILLLLLPHAGQKFPLVQKCAPCCYLWTPVTMPAIVIQSKVLS